MSGIQKISEVQILFPVSEEKMVEMEKRFAVVPDCNTKDGYNEAKKGIRELVSCRTSLEDGRLEMTRDAREFQAKVNELGKSLKGRIEKLEGPWKNAKKAVDDEKKRIKEEKARIEMERVNGLRAKVKEIQDCAFLGVGAYSSQQCLEAMAKLATIEVDEDTFEELVKEAAQCKQLAEYQLKDMYNVAVEREEREAAEAKRKAEEKAEQERIAEENRIERERLAKEAAEFEAEQRREREEWQARIDAENAEREIIRQEREAREAAKRQAEQDAWRREQEAIAEKNREAERQRVEEQARIDAENAERQERIEADRRKLNEQIAETQRIKDAANASTRQEDPEEIKECDQSPALSPEDKIFDALLSVHEFVEQNSCGLDVNNLLQNIMVAIVQGEIPHVKYTGGDS
jgi:hypothetical protein